MSGTYTVCTLGCNYSSVQSAVNALYTNGVSGPVTIKISSGNYNGRVTFNGSITGVSSTNTVTFKGAGSKSGGTRLYYSQDTLMLLSSVSYLRFQDMKFENTGTSTGYEFYTVYTSYSSYIKFNNCSFLAQTPTNYPGAYLTYNYREDYSSNIVINNSRFYGGAYAFYRYADAGSTYDTTSNSSFVMGYQNNFYAYQGEDNAFFNNRLDSLNNSWGTTISFEYEVNSAMHDNYINSQSTALNIWNSSGEKIYNNTFLAQGEAIYIYGPNNYNTSTPFVIYNNFLSSQGYGCFDISDYTSDTGKNVHILHNTIYWDNNSSWSGNFSVENGSASSGWDIRNNNVYNTQAGDHVFKMYYAGKSDIISGNNYYGPSGSVLVDLNNERYTDLASYLSDVAPLGLGKFDHSVSVSFQNAPTDLHYTASSTLPWGKAVSMPLKITKDIDGDSRCTLFATAGADEGKPSSSKPTSGFTFPSKIVDGSPVTFYNTGKTSEAKNYRWYIDGKFVTDSIDLFTTALKAPSAKVTLVTESCGGKDSLTKTFTVSTPTKAPISDFIADRNVIKAGETVKFTDLSPNYPSSWAWDVSPKLYNFYGSKVPTFTYVAGDSTRPFMQIRFDNPGKYKVCLTTSNTKGSGGTECKSQYIEVLGSYNMGNNTVITDAKGYLYDDGGPDNIYSGNNTTALIDPGCAKKIYLIFNKFDLSCGDAFLRIFDGPDNKAPELTPCTTNILYGSGPGLTGGPSGTCWNPGITCIPKVTDTFVAKSGQMFLSMQAGYNYNSKGFEAFFWSDPKAQKPAKANFTSTDSVCTNAYLDFTNTSSGDNLSYQWDMDGDLSYFEDTRKNTSYPFIYPGQYTITLIASNCTSTDTFQKVIKVYDPAAPKVDFHADNLNPTTNDVVFLIPNIKECVDDYRWEVSKKYGAATITYVNGTSNASPIAQVMLSDTGCYDVKLVASNVSGTDSTFKGCHLFVKQPYCIPSVTRAVTDLGIDDVSLSTTEGVTLFHNISKQTGGYENYTPTVSGSMEIGVSYAVSVSRSTSANKAVRTIYIDWNADGDFGDSLEMAASETPGNNLSWNDTLTVPPFAKTGATVMRVSITQGSQISDPCNNSFGEYEDYRIYIDKDRTPPVITLKGMDTIRVEQGYPFSDPGATATDNLDGNLTSKIVLDKNGFDILTPGMYVFTYNVQDNAGNSAAARKRVVIVTPDKTAPELEVDADDTIMVGVFTSFTEPTYSAVDLVDGTVTNDVSVTDPVNINVVDTYSVTYVVSDVDSNRAQKIITVIVADTTAPVLRIKGASTVYHDVNTAYTDSGVKVSDNYYPDSLLKALLVVNNNVDIHKPGTYTISYALTDPSGNKANTATRTVVIQDTMAPVASLNGGNNVMLEVNDKFVDAGLSITDNYYSSFTIDTSGDFYSTFHDGIATTLGKYSVIYKITDGSGNSTTIIRMINVVDTKAPDIILLGSEDTIVCRWSDYADAGYSLKDNYFTNAQIKVDTLGTFQNTLKEGFYTRYYVATDPSGNTSRTSVKRTIWVQSPENCGATSINTKELDRYFHIYPNPSSGLFTVTSNLPTEKEVRVTVTNLLGQEVAANSSQVLGKGEIQVDLRNEPAGVYLLNIYTASQVITRQIIVSK